MADVTATTVKQNSNHLYFRGVLSVVLPMIKDINAEMN